MLKHTPDKPTIRKLPTVLTAPPTRPREMPDAEISIWTPARAISAMSRAIVESFGKPVKAVRDEA